MMTDLSRYAESSAQRIEQARKIADSLRYDEKLHRLASHAVFVLEDCHEIFVRMGKPSATTTTKDLSDPPP